VTGLTLGETSLCDVVIVTSPDVIRSGRSGQ
jgi:hypothetical protein